MFRAHPRLFLAAVAVLAVGCSATGTVASAPAPTPQIIYVTPTPGGGTRPPNAPASATPAPVDAATTPPEDDNVFAAGETITVTEDGSPILDIVVSRVQARASYKGEYYDDTPQIKGNVFLEAWVSYTALADNASYGSFDWSLFANDTAIDTWAFVVNGPEPTLGSGNLPKGRKAEGWLVYEVPPTGRVLLSYNPNMFSNDAPVFEVVLRPT